MAPKTIYPRTNDDPRRNSGDPALADIRKIQTELRARKPIRTTSSYVTPDFESDNDLDVFKEKEEEPQVPQRPPIQALLDAMEEFDKKPLASMDRRDSTKYEKAMQDPKNWVHCPMDGCSKQFVWQSALLDHLREKHPDIVRYDQWLKQQVQSPFLHFRKQREYAEEDVHGLESQIQRYQPLLKELQNRKIKIQDKYGVSETAYRYGRSSPEAELAREKSADELAPVLKRIADVQGDIGAYTIRRNQAERQYNFAERKIEDMEKDGYIGPLLKPIELQGGKQTWLFDKERKMLGPIVDAISSASVFERAAWSASPIPSKGTLIPQRSAKEEAEHVRDLQSYVREYDPDYM
jgi:hypothetical protein